GLDGSYSEKALIGRLNSDLANDLGNLLHRSLTMIEKYFQGSIPQPGAVQDFDQHLVCQTKELPQKYFQAMDNIEFGQALDAIWILINTANKYIEDSQPWRLSKEHNTERLSRIVYNLAEVLRLVAILVYPFIPATSLKMLGQLGLKEDLNQQLFEQLVKFPGYPLGTAIKKGQPLFPRII
ncbi:MAG: class I tRNA ligase family protein, partial [Candidatus Omnitrophica bacterium]|nr:class I tRNA ligase family protein [Candidatus Omnitrophota bacterium]